MNLERLRTKLATQVTRDAFVDGFLNVLMRSETSSPADNPYVPHTTEHGRFLRYQAGAQTAEDLLRRGSRQKAELPEIVNLASVFSRRRTRVRRLSSGQWQEVE